MTSTETARVDTALEYERARTEAASVALDRSLLVVSGPLRQKFLQGLVSNDVLARKPGEGCRAALMDAKGHLRLFLRVLVRDADIVLEVPAARRAELEATLTHYRVAAPVRFATSDEQVMGLVGPRVIETLTALGADVSALPLESHVTTALAGAPVRVCRAGDLPAAGYVLHVPASHAEAVRSALARANVTALSAASLDALRIEDGRAWYDVDVTDKNLLHETGLVAEYHSPTKGCYVGQEVVARLVARGGNVSQRLCGLRLAEARPAGTRLQAGDKDAGVLTTASVSPRRGPIAMGYVHRSHADPGVVLVADGAPAEVVALPMVTS